MRMQVILWSMHMRASSNIEVLVVDGIVCGWFLRWDGWSHRTVVLIRDCIWKVPPKDADSQVQRHYPGGPRYFYWK